MKSSLDLARFLISQGDTFDGYDETSTSLNKGTHGEMVDRYKDKVDIYSEGGTPSVSSLEYVLELHPVAYLVDVRDYEVEAAAAGLAVAGTAGRR